MFEHLNRIPVEAIYVSVAAVGGLTRYLQIYLSYGEFSLRKLSAHMVISAFSGYMFFLFGLNIVGAPESAAAIVAGVGGWMGADAMKALEAWLQERLNKKQNDTK